MSYKKIKFSAIGCVALLVMACGSDGGSDAPVDNASLPRGGDTPQDTAAPALDAGVWRISLSTDFEWGLGSLTDLNTSTKTDATTLLSLKKDESGNMQVSSCGNREYELANDDVSAYESNSCASERVEHTVIGNDHFRTETFCDGKVSYATVTKKISSEPEYNFGAINLDYEDREGVNTAVGICGGLGSSSIVTTFPSVLSDALPTIEDSEEHTSTIHVEAPYLDGYIGITLTFNSKDIVPGNYTVVKDIEGVTNDQRVMVEVDAPSITGTFSTGDVEVISVGPYSADVNLNVRDGGLFGDRLTGGFSFDIDP